MFLKELDPSLKIMPIESHEGFVPGNPEWSSVENADTDLKNTFHLFPHKVKGEGHYVSLLTSTSSEEAYSTTNRYSVKKYPGNIKEIDEFLAHLRTPFPD